MKQQLRPCEGESLLCWFQEDLLGPLPFVKLGEFGDSMELGFDSETLNECDSNQVTLLISFNSTFLKSNR